MNKNNTGKKHSWNEGTLNGFQAFQCEECDFIVVAVHSHPDFPPGKERHVPGRGIILGIKRGEKITVAICDMLCEKHKVPCYG